MPPPIPTPMKTVTPTAPLKTTTTTLTTHATTHHVTHTATGLPLYNPLAGIHASPITIAIVGIGILIAIILGFRWMKTHRIPRGELIYALAIDRQKHEVEVVPCEKLHDRLYVARGTEPAFLVLSPKVSVFKLRQGKTEVNVVFAKKKGVLLVPVDPSLMEELGIPETLDEGALELDNKSIMEALKEMYTYVGKREGSIKITPTTKIMIAYNPPRLVQDIIDQTMEGGASVIQHMFSTIKSVDVLEKAAQSMIKYITARSSVIIYLAILAIAVGIAIFLAMQVMH